MPAVGPHSMVMVEMACKDMVKNIHIYICIKPTNEANISQMFKIITRIQQQQ